MFQAPKSYFYAEKKYVREALYNDTRPTDQSAMSSGVYVPRG